MQVSKEPGWPPNYTEKFAWRQLQLRRMRKNPHLMTGSKEYYRTRPQEFISHWCDTYDPRNAGSGMPARMPFCLFKKQNELVEFLLTMLQSQEDGLIEKSRDMGATWVACAFSVWLWLYWDGSSVGWGSRKEQLVAKIGDPDSIFEKIRMIINYLPKDFLPKGFNPKEHMSYMRIVNPENKSTITGEAGDNIGRGGRKLIYFKDESAHYERPEKIEASLADNTRVQIDFSSVNGLGNVFHRKREAGKEWESGQEAHKGVTNIFVMDWSDHPYKTQEWYDRRRAKAENDGLLHIFAQEVERSYDASVEGIIIPAEWVKSAIDAHIHLGFGAEGMWGAGLDVADEGLDKNAIAIRKGSVLTYIEDWGGKDTGATARKAIGLCEDKAPIEVQYDCIGVGAGVKSEYNRVRDEGILKSNIKFIPWDAGASPKDKDKHMIPGDKQSPLNGDFYANLKAQGWWELRRRFERTHKAITELIQYDPDELISLSSDMPQLKTLQKELSQPTAGKSSRLKLLVEKQPEGTRSPNLADAVMMAFWPVKKGSYTLSNLG